MENQESTLTPGLFQEFLARNSKQIRQGRAENISEEALIEYKRKAEDIEHSLKKLRRTRNNMLDMSPDNTYTILNAKDFDAKEFTDEYHRIGVKIRNLEIEYEIVKKDLKELFNVNFQSTL